MIIANQHPDQSQPLLHAVAGVLEAMGAEVRIDAQGHNLVRRSEASDHTRAPLIIEAEGLPNLLHELVHVVQLGRLAPDHDTPYRQIPFDLECERHRALLWQELACCVVSCAYLTGNTRAIDAWFADQVGIQQEFFRLGGDRETFLAGLDDLARRHADELEGVVARAYTSTEHFLRAGGVAAALSRAPQRFKFAELWQRLRAPA